MKKRVQELLEGGVTAPKSQDKLINEVAQADHDFEGRPNQDFQPVDTGSNARPLDNVANGEQGTVKTSIGDVPVEQLISAIAQQLAGLDRTDLEQIIDFSGIDFAAFPAQSTPDFSQANLASIKSTGTISEDIKELFKDDETLTEDFKTKASVLFESTLNLKVSEIKKTLEEDYALKNKESLEKLVEGVAEVLDNKTDYIAERFVENNKPVIQESVESVIATKAMTEIKAILENYNFVFEPVKIDVVNDLEDKIKNLQETVDAFEVEKTALVLENTEFKRQSKIVELTEGMTPLQGSKFKALLETLEYSDLSDFELKSKILAESVLEKPKSTLTEGAKAIPLMEKTNIIVETNSPKNEMLRYLS